MRIEILLGCLSLAVVASIGAGACSSGGSGAGISTSVSGGKPVNSLSDAEQAQYCTDLGNWAKNALSTSELATSTCQNRALKAGLTLSGTSFSFDKSKCAAAFDACMASPPSGTTTGIDCGQLKTGTSTCPATVAQVDQCLTDESTQAHARTALGKGVCDTVDLEAGTTGAVQPPSCAALPAGCAFFGGKGGASPGGDAGAGGD